MEKLLSASEIAKLKIPGLPTTRAAVNVMAKREGWEYEETTGIGGVRKLYKIPARYLPRQDGGDAPVTPQTALTALNQVAGTVVAGTSRVDPVKLELAIRALTEWEAERGVKVPEDRRPAVIALLYDYVQNSLGENTDSALALVLRAIG